MIAIKRKRDIPTDLTQWTGDAKEDICLVLLQQTFKIWKEPDSLVSRSGLFSKLMSLLLILLLNEDPRHFCSFFERFLV